MVGVGCQGTQHYRYCPWIAADVFRRHMVCVCLCVYVRACDMHVHACVNRNGGWEVGPCKKTISQVVETTTLKFAWLTKLSEEILNFQERKWQQLAQVAYTTASINLCAPDHNKQKC